VLTVSDRTCNYTKDDLGEKLCAAPAEYEVVEPDSAVVDACAEHAATIRAEMEHSGVAGYAIRSPR
jgi:hypothetical protein